MEIENLFRYTALAVGLKPSANQGKARLRGLYRIIYSKTISPRLCKAKPACAGYGGGNTPHHPCASVISVPIPTARGGRIRCGIDHHPCASVISVPIRGLFRLYKVKPACAKLWRVMYSKTMTPGGRWSVFARCNPVRAVFSEQHKGRDP